MDSKLCDRLSFDSEIHVGNVSEAKVGLIKFRVLICKFCEYDSR